MQKCVEILKPGMPDEAYSEFGSVGEASISYSCFSIVLAELERHTMTKERKRDKGIAKKNKYLV